MELAAWGRFTADNGDQWVAGAIGSMKTSTAQHGKLFIGLLSILIAMPSVVSANAQPPMVLAANELQGKICQASIQDRIEWDYEGRNRWARENLEKICKNAAYSLQPGACFQRVMHGGISHGSGTRWHWSPALRLCAGTQDSGATISCFSKAIDQQIPWRQAIEKCRARP